MTRNVRFRSALTVCVVLLTPPLVLAQSDTRTKSSGSAKPERRIVRIIGDVKLDVRQWPLVGSPDAKYVFVEMFDYTCPHCRDMHHAVEEAFEKYGDNLAVITLAVPLSTECNNQIGRTKPPHRESCELANLAVAVWKLKPEKHREYHGWLLGAGRSRTAAEARTQALKIVDEDKLQTLLKKGLPQKFIASHVKLYARAGRGSIPKVLFPNVTLTGNVGSERLIATIERELSD